MTDKSELMRRWETDPAFKTVMLSIFMDVDEFTKLGYGKPFDWYKSVAPKASHYHFVPYVGHDRQESLDCRGMDLHGRNLTNVDLQYILDYSDLSGCFLKGTGFQHASARYVDFSGSKFEHVQMSPIFAQGASFRDCVFEGGWLFGHGTFNNNQGDFSDLRECDFTNCKINGANISHADLSQSNLTNARIKDCNFALSVFKGANFKDAQFESCNFSGGDPAVYPDCLVDMRGVNFSGTVFRRCDFSYCQIDDTEQARFVVGRGGNKGIDLIQWMPPIYPLPN